MRRAASSGSLSRRLAAVAVIAVSPLLTAGSCSHTISFVNPIIDEGGRVLDPRIEGEWVRADSAQRDHWAVRFDSSAVGYVVAIAPPALAHRFLAIDLAFATDSATRRRLQRDPAARARRASDSTALYRLGDDSAGPRLVSARLGRIDSALVLVIAPAGLRAAQRLRGLRIDAYMIGRLTVGEGELRLIPLNGTWLEAMLDSSRVTLTHVTTGGLEDGTLVTATTGEVRQALAPFVHDPAAFRDRDAIVLRRSVPRRPARR